MKLGAAMAAGAVAGSMLRPDAASADHSANNFSSATDDPAIHAENTSNDGPAIVADAIKGDAVRGHADGQLEGGIKGVGVRGTSFEGLGVVGESEEWVGVAGTSHNGIGVAGNSRSEGFPAILGVWSGESETPQAGVLGYGDESGIGVQGVSPGNMPSVLASSGELGAKSSVTPDGGLALQVIGRSHFSTVGTGMIAEKADASDVIVDSAVSPNSHIMVTLTGDPGSGIAISWVKVGNGEFQVYVTDKVKQDTPLSYFVIN